MNDFLDLFTSDDILTNQRVSLRMPYSSFEGLIAFTRGELSKDQFMDLFYFHSTVEKSIVSLKNRDINTGIFIYEQVARFNRDDTAQQVRNGVESAFLACTAYYKYATGKYEEAYGHLQALVPYVVEQSKIMPMFLANLYEQNLNMMRIHFRQKDEEKIVEKMIQIMDSLLFDINEIDTLHPDLAAFDEKERRTWFFYIMDSFFLGMNNTFPNDPGTRRQLYIRVLEHLLERHRVQPTQFTEFMSGIKMILHAQKNEVAEFEQLICDEFDNIRLCPSLMRTMILSRFLNFAHENGRDLTIHPNYPHFESVLHQYSIKIPGKVSNAA